MFSPLGFDKCLFLHPTLPAQGIKSCGTLSPCPLAAGMQSFRVDLCFPFSWQTIWDLLGSSRQDGKTSETFWGGEGRSLFIPLPMEVGAMQLP